MNAGDKRGRGEVTGATRDQLASTFGAALRRRRREAGLTQAQLAELTKMNVQSISRFERGRRRPRWDTIQILAQALAIGRRWARQEIESDLMTAAENNVVFDGRGRARRRHSASRGIEALELSLNRRLENLAATSADPAFAERLRAAVAANEADRAARSQRDHAPHNPRSEAGPVDT